MAQPRQLHLSDGDFIAINISIFCEKVTKKLQSLVFSFLLKNCLMAELF